MARLMFAVLLALAGAAIADVPDAEYGPLGGENDVQPQSTPARNHVNEWAVRFRPTRESSLEQAEAFAKKYSMINLGQVSTICLF